MQSEDERGTSDDLSHYFLCAPTQSQSAAGDEGETSRAKSDKTRRTDGRNPSALWKIPADADFYLPLCVKSQALSLGRGQFFASHAGTNFIKPHTSRSADECKSFKETGLG